MKTHLCDNLKMNNEVYKLRRKVIEIIYELKKITDLPRLTVRIAKNNEAHPDILGAGRIGRPYIWITEQTLEMAPNELFSVVVHEVGHAVYGLRHDEKCPLMSAYHKPISKAQTLKIFKKWGKSL